jgi:hypothetical protein
MACLFISYSSSDANLANDVAEALHALNHERQWTARRWFRVTTGVRSSTTN